LDSGRWTLAIHASVASRRFPAEGRKASSDLYSRGDGRFAFPILAAYANMKLSGCAQPANVERLAKPLKTTASALLE
jgi:hypothetical protein